nr:ribonuclease H-like domain-containing protein [Tanacetum cinerariifolium]
ETFKATKEEQLLDTYLRYLQVINDLKKCGYKKENCELNYKFLNNLQPEWKQYGDVNDALGYKKKAIVVTSDPLALVTEKINDLKKITALLAKSFNRKKYYAKRTNNNLRTSSSSSLANKKPEYVKSVEKKEDKKKRDMSKTKMLLAKKDSDKQVLLAEDQAWLESSSDSDQKINANMVFMAQIEKVLSYSDESSSSAKETIAEVKHVMIDIHTECQAQYAKLEEERFEYMIRYSALCDNDKQHRKKIDKQEILFDKMSRELVEMNNNVLRLQEKILEKETKILELEGCVSNKDVEIEKYLERLNECENKLYKIRPTNQRIHMIMPSKDTLYNGRKEIGFENPSYFGSAKDLRPSLYDEKVIGLGYTSMFLIHSDEALEIEKFKRERENKNRQVSSLKPYVPTVILEKIIIDLEDEVVSLLEKEKANLKTIESLKSKGFESNENAISESENQSEKECDQVENSKVIALGLFKLSVSQSVSPISIHSKLNKDVRRYSHTDLLSCNNSHLGETSSAYVCNDAMNVSCNSRLCDSFDENNLLIFDDKSDRISPVSKMPFRKKPRDSMNVRSKSNSNKSLPGTVHRWLPKMQPLAEPVAKWIPRIYLWIIDSGCSKHMTGNRTLLTNFVEKFLGMVCFGNNDFAVIAGYGDVGLEVAFRKSTCFVRNKDGVDLLTGDRSSNLYTISLNEVASNSSTCLLAKASSSQSLLWHQRLSNLNFAKINNLVKNNLVQGLHKMKFSFVFCVQTREDSSETSQVQNGFCFKQATLSSSHGFVWPNKTQVNLQLQVQHVRTDNGTEFKNKTHAKFFDEIMKSSTTNVETFNAEIPSNEEEVFHESFKSFQEESSSSSLNDDVQQSLEEVGVSLSNTQSISNNMIPNVDEEKEVFHESFKSFQEESSSSSLNDDVQQSLEEVGVSLSNTQSISNNMIPNVDEESFVSKKYPDHVYALDKALYGLKQAPRAWYDVLSQFLIDSSFQKGSIDTTLFIKKKGLWYPKDYGFDLTAYSDADHAGCHLDRKTESEYVAVFSCCAQVLWMRTQLTDYDFFYDKVSIYCDLKSATAILCNLVQHTRTKHTDVRYHFIKNHVEKGMIELYFVGTEYQLADLFTKSLPEARFKFLVDKLGMMSRET